MGEAEFNTTGRQLIIHSNIIVYGNAAAHLAQAFPDLCLQVGWLSANVGEDGLQKPLYKTPTFRRRNTRVNSDVKMTT